jgi:hypothetical protein
MRWLIILLFYSCSSVGPNYNQGQSHNSSLNKRHSIVMKEDKNMKNKMIKHRKVSSRVLKKNKKVKKNRKMRFIN